MALLVLELSLQLRTMLYARSSSLKTFKRGRNIFQLTTLNPLQINLPLPSHFSSPRSLWAFIFLQVLRPLPDILGKPKLPLIAALEAPVMLSEYFHSESLSDHRQVKNS